MKTLGKSPLDINLTKWLSRCEVHFTKAKGKDNYKVKMMLEGAELKKQGKETKIELPNGNKENQTRT